MVIIILINHCQINFDNPKMDDEFKIFDTLFIFESSKLFFEAFENISDEHLKNIINDEYQKSSKDLFKTIDILYNYFNESENIINIDKSYSTYLEDIFKGWYDKFEKFNNNIIKINYEKKGDSNRANIEKGFENLIMELKYLEHDDFIMRAIKYIEKIDKNEKSLENTKKYVEAIKDEYQNKKIKSKEAFIKFEFQNEDFVKNYESELLKNDYKNKFNKVYSLIKYNDCLKLVENIEKSKDKFEQDIYLNKLDKILYKKNVNKKFKNGLKILRKILFNDVNSIDIQYFKDILLSNLLLEYFIIDNSCFFFNLENIYEEFNKYISRENIDIEDRKFAFYLSNNISPKYEIIIPSININSILILFLQKSYKKYKNGLITLELGINRIGDNKNNFEKEIFEFQNNKEIKEMNMIQGLNKFVNICKKTIFNREDIKSLISPDLKENKKIINELFIKLDEIRKLDGGKFFEQAIMIIKGLYDSANLPKKKLEMEDLFFIENENWKESIKDFSKHKYLIYFLMKNPDLENDLRKYLQKSEYFLKNDKNKFPIYTHILRILSSQNELSFQGKTYSYTSELIEKLLVEKIKNKIKEDITDNLD